MCQQLEQVVPKKRPLLTLSLSMPLELGQAGATGRARKAHQHQQRNS